MDIVNKVEKKANNIGWEIKLVGWAGTVLIVTAYTLTSLGYINTSNIIYPILNLLGAVFMGIRVFVGKNWANLFLEFFWALIAIISILKFFNLV